MKIPIKLNLCPIIESVFEIRFDSSLDANIVFALIYSKLKDDFPKVETLPLSELPASMRDADPNLKYQPAYKLHYKDNENIILLHACSPPFTQPFFLLQIFQHCSSSSSIIFLKSL